MRFYAIIDKEHLIAELEVYRQVLPALNPTYWRDIRRVTTRSQAARDYGVHVTTVQMWIDQGYVVGEKIGGVWIISTPSLIAYRGSPSKTRKTEYTNS